MSTYIMLEVISFILEETIKKAEKRDDTELVNFCSNMFGVAQDFSRTFFSICSRRKNETV